MITLDRFPAARIIGKAPTWLPSACLLLAAWAMAIRQTDLEWSINPEYQYGWIVPLLALILWWRAWPDRPSPRPPVASAAIPYLVALIIIPALPIRIIEEANPDWRPLNDYFALQAVLLTALIIDYSGGKAWLRHFAFPILFPLIAVPWPSVPEYEVVQGLQRCIASIGVEGASWMGWSAVQNGNLIVLAHGTVGVNEACSGIRSLQSSLMIALFLGDYFLLTISRRFALVFLALIAAFFLNAVRAFLLIVAMDTHGPDTLLKFHDPAGFGIAFVCLLVLWTSANLLAGSKAPPRPAAASQSREATLRFPLRWIVLLLVVWTLVESVNQGWYAWHERTTLTRPLWTLRWPPPRPGFREEKIDETVPLMLRYDHGWHGTWQDDRSRWEMFFFTWNPGRATAGLAQSHRPDICLPAAGFIMKEQLPVKNIEVNGVILPVTRFIFQDPASLQIYYVFQSITDDRVWTEPFDVQDYNIGLDYRLRTAWVGRRNPGQRSLLVTNQGADSLDEAEAAFRRLLADSVVISRP